MHYRALAGVAVTTGGSCTAARQAGALDLTPHVASLGLGFRGGGVQGPGV